MSDPTPSRRSPDLLGSNVHLLEVRTREDDIVRAKQLVTSLPATPEAAARGAALANMVGLIAQGRAEDYEQTAALGVELGHQRLADLQGELDGCLGGGPNVPFTTAAIIELSRTSQIEATLLRAGRTATAAYRVAIRCANAAFWLLMTDIDPARRAPMPRTPDDLLATVEQCGADTWRQILANIAAHPFSPVAVDLSELARSAGLEPAAQAIERCALVWRERARLAERAEVAAEVRGLVEASGCSQREFARHVGTSASRMSTYAHGSVSPSASMMLRIRWRSSELARKNAAAEGRPPADAGPD